MGVCSSSASVGERHEATGGPIELIDATNIQLAKAITAEGEENETAATSGGGGGADTTNGGGKGGELTAANGDGTAATTTSKDEEKEEDPSNNTNNLNPIVFPSSSGIRPGTGGTVPRLRAAGTMSQHARAGSVSLPRAAPAFTHAATQLAAPFSHHHHQSRHANSQYAHKRNQSISKSYVQRATDEEEAAEAAEAANPSNHEPASAPTQHKQHPPKQSSRHHVPHRRAVSVSLPSGHTGHAGGHHRHDSKLQAEDDDSDESPTPTTPQQMLRLSREKSSMHGPSARSRNNEPTLAQQIMQRHVAAAAASSSPAIGSSTTPTDPLLLPPTLSRPTSGLKISTTKPVGDRRPSVDSIARRPSIDAIAAQQQNGSMRRPSIDSIKAGAMRERKPSIDFVPTSIRAGMAGGGSVSLFERNAGATGSAAAAAATGGGGGTSIQAREASAARTEELWIHYAGRGANHMHRRGLLQLSEDIFYEFTMKYRSKLTAQAAAKNAKKSIKDQRVYTEELLERDLKTDLPFLLPAYTTNKDHIPSHEEYVTYIFRFAMKEMKRVAGSSNGGGNNTPGGMTDSPGSAGGSMQEKAPKLTKIEFIVGWTHCHELLFQAIDKEDTEGSTLCKLM